MCVRAPKSGCDVSPARRRPGDRRGLAGRVQARLVRIITSCQARDSVSGWEPLRRPPSGRAAALETSAAQLLDVVLHHLELAPRGRLTVEMPVHLVLELGEAPLQRLDVLLRPPERPIARRLRSGRAATGRRRRWRRPASARASAPGRRRPPQAPAPRSRRPRRCARRACGRAGRPRREARRCAPGDRRAPGGRCRSAGTASPTASSARASRPIRRGGCAGGASALGPGRRANGRRGRRMRQARLAGARRPRRPRGRGAGPCSTQARRPAGQVVGVPPRLPEGRGGQRRAVPRPAVEDHRPVPRDRLRLAGQVVELDRGGRPRSCPPPTRRGDGRRSTPPRRPRSDRRPAPAGSRSRWLSPLPLPLSLVLALFSGGRVTTPATRPKETSPCPKP